LRHYFAREQLRHGCSIKKLQAMLGHKSAVETLDIYGHLIGDEDDRSREVMQGALGACHGNATVEPLAERFRRSKALDE
jgi:integrase